MKRCLQCSVAFDSADWRCPSCGQQPRTDGDIPVLAPDLVEGDGTDADYPFDVLVRAEASHFWFRNRASLISWMIRTHFPAARSILEVGCGAGGVLQAIQRSSPGARLVGSELLVRGLREAKRRVPHVQFLQMDARHIPFESEFHVIGAFDVLEHIDDDQGVLREMHRALVGGGGIVLTVPQHRWLWSAFDELSAHKRRYTRAELMGKLSASGFQVVRVTSFTSFALPLMVASRIRRRAIDLDRELTIAPAVNWALTGVASLERAAIRAGASFPAGGSLLAVAVRSS